MSGVISVWGQKVAFMNMLTLSLATALLGERIEMQQEGECICKNVPHPLVGARCLFYTLLR